MGGHRTGTPRISNRSRRAGLAVRMLVLAAAVALVAAPARPSEQPGRHGPVIGGPYGRLLADSADLGPARGSHAQVIVALRDPTRPPVLMGWADKHGLSVGWQPGQDWAVVEGAPEKVAEAFAVAVHNYRSPDGQVFYAAARQPDVPVAVRAEVTDVGRILGYGRHRMARPPTLPLDVPGDGLTPTTVVTAYDTTPLQATGKGQTIAFFEWGDYDTADLDAYAKLSDPPLARFNVAPPVGGMPPHNGASEETELDLEAAHAVAPDARLVVVNANAFMPDDENFSWTQVGDMFNAVDREYRGAVWSSSIGTGPCDQMLKDADVRPAQSALAAAETHGTSAFDASGDTAGLECKENLTGHWGAKPTPDDVGLDSMASLPSMTDVGGTTLSTDKNGVWLAEETWVDYAMQQGTGGGISAMLPRPDWPGALSGPEDSGQKKHRLAPDVAAIADPDTGMQVVIDQHWHTVGGTSLAAPLWAGFAALMNQYLLANGGRALGELNPLLYWGGRGAPQPAFHDVTLGGNAAYTAGPGYDLVTGLGTPDVDNLAHNILDIQ